MAPVTRIDDDVMEALKSLAEPFVDTPNTVIRRLLQEKGVIKVAPPEPPKPRLTRSSAQVPQSVYEKYLLYVLARMLGGQGHKHEVTKEVIRQMKSHGWIGPIDEQHVSTGETRAENTIAWGRNALKDRGLINPNSRRGEWLLNEHGMQEGLTMQLPVPSQS